MVGSYDYRLVALSVLVAVVAAYPALDLGGRVTATRGRARLGWLIGGATALGIGIWSMHYVGMLAFVLPVPMLYDWPTVLLSLLAGILSSAVAFFVVSRPTVGEGRALAGSAVMGGGIAAMHYIAMASMRMPARTHYSPPLVTLSILVAIMMALMSLALTFHFRDEPSGQRFRKVASALLMGMAIASMHYTGMAAASFTPAPAAPDLSHAVRISSLAMAGIGIVSQMVLALTLLTSLLDRLERQRVLLHELFEQAPQAVVLMDVNGAVMRVNREFTRLFGYGPGEAHGRRLGDLIVPDDSREEDPRPTELAGRGHRVDVEVIRRRKDGSPLHVLMVSVPVSLPGGQRALYAIYHDITDRKEAENQLRMLSGRLLRLRDEERRRLARELHDSTAQLLAGLRINLSVVNEVADTLPPRIQGAVAESVALADQSIRDLRTVSYVLHPPELDELGLQVALTRYVDGFSQRSGIRVELDVPAEIGRLPEEIETTVFRIVQESLANIHRHSGSSQASIRVVRGASELTVDIQDAGRGIRASTAPGVGIASMRQRVEHPRGTINIASDESGTGVTVVIPLSHV